MPFSTSVYRTAACVVVVGALGGLASCAAEPTLRIISPTMAPDQTIAEACELSGEEIDQVTVKTEQQIKEGLSQAAAAKLMGVTQPRISDLVRGKIDLFSIDMLINMASAAGLHVDLKIARAA